MSLQQGESSITPFLWFDRNAEEAVDFYLTVFRNSAKHGEMKMGGKVLTVSFALDGQRFTAMNGGPLYKFTEAISFSVRCETQAEIDNYWTKLTADGGSECQCGWLKDKYGLTWQIVPSNLTDLPKSPTQVQAMMGMKKLNIAVLEQAGK